jgi:exportin-2 (importin alpha re-exporter)
MNPALTDQFEKLLFPPFQSVLSMDVVEFSPYVFQILSQLLEFRPDGISEAYRALFPPLLAPQNWERKANCPALARLLKAYLKQGASEILPHLEGMLGVFQKLLALKSTETSAFSLLDAIVCKIPMESLAQYLQTIFQLLMMRLQQNKTQSFSFRVVVSISLIAAKHGGLVAVENGLETVQPGITAMIVNSVWGKTVEATPPTNMDAKICAVGISRILTESAVVQGDENTWCVLLGSLISVLDPKTAVKLNAEEDDTLDEVVGFDGDNFSKLHFTGGNVDDDVLPEIPDAPTHAVRLLGGICASSPGMYSQRAARFLPQEKVEALQAYCARAGVNFN